MKRGRNQRRRQGGNPNRAYDSNGPDVRIRGTANQIYDKYLSLARDASSSGDRVKAENYLQHAEHYFRVLRAAQPNQPVPAAADDEDGDDQRSDEADRRPRRSDSRRDPGDAPQPEIRDREPASADEGASAKKTTKPPAEGADATAAQAAGDAPAGPQAGSQAGDAETPPAPKSPRPARRRRPRAASSEGGEDVRAAEPADA